MRLTVAMVVCVGAGLGCAADDGATDTRDEAGDGTDEVGDGGGDVSDGLDGELDNTADVVDTTPGDVSGVPLDGTALEGIVVKWPAALELCNAWREGATLEAELAHKVRVTLGAQERSDLAFASLEAQTIADVKVMTGPFAADQRRAVVADTTIADYRVVRGEGYDGLFAEVRHDLGAAGVLYESYSLTRSPGQTTDVVVGAGGDLGYEVVFAWAPGAATESHQLEPCAPPEGGQQAIAVLVATNASATAKAATLLRFYDTRTVFAGSYPVRLAASQVILSDQPWRTIEASGPWAQTYVAAHHNWNESTQLDFARDLAAYQTYYKDLAAGLQIPPGQLAKVQLAGVGGGPRGTVTITRLAADGTPSDVVYDAGEWRRVDGKQLMREAGCDGAVVGAVGLGDHIAMLVFCPDPDGIRGLELVTVVPVVWTLEPPRAGERIEGAAITRFSGRLGWGVEVGAGTFTVEAMNEDGWITDVLDADGTSLGQAYATLGTIEPRRRWEAPIASWAGDVRIDVARHWADQGVGESSIYAVDAVTLAWGGESHTVTAWDRIDYVNTHHNWNDTLAATTDDGYVLHWKIIYDFENALGLVETVWAEDAAGNEVLAPTVVTPIGSGQ